MKNDTVTGGGGLKLHVAEAGNPAGKPILFIHGFSQCRLAWRKQIESELARDFRLIAMDIRGHGSSDKPPGVYGESKLWADDVRAVIAALGLERPVLSGWSYGGVIISDYVDRSRDVDNDPAVRRMRKPMLLSYGDADDVVPTMGRHVAGLASHARLSMYPGVGHAPFWEAPERFNRELATSAHRSDPGGRGDFTRRRARGGVAGGCTSTAR